MELKTVYFEQPGKDNTEAVFKLVQQRINELGIKKLVIASTGGDTAAKAVNYFNNVKIIAVAHSTGFAGANTSNLLRKTRKLLKVMAALFLSVHTSLPD